jgi:SP family sugar:H+ symporter-like MFS transporter
MVVMYQLMICAGIAWSYGLSWATSGIPNRACWMIPVGFQLFIGLVIAVGILFLPESPRLLLGRGNVEAASRSIATLNAVPIDHPLVHEEIAELEALLAVEEQAGKGRWIDLLSTKHQLWKRTMNACVIQFVQQLNGQNFYYYFGPTFFAQSRVGLSSYAIQFILGEWASSAYCPCAQSANVFLRILQGWSLLLDAFLPCGSSSDSDAVRCCS